MIWINAEASAKLNIAHQPMPGLVRRCLELMTITATQAAARRTAEIAGLALHASETPALARLTVNAQTLRLRRRQPITQTADGILILRSGMIAAEHAALGTERTMVELHYPGDIISAPPASLAPMMTYTSMAPSEVWRLSAADFSAAMANDAELTNYVLQQLNLQRARKQLHISMLAALSSEQRVAALLLQAAGHLGTTNGQSVSFEMPLSRTEVAEYLALNADTLSRIMSRLTREGVLARSSRAQLTIRDMDALKAYCPLGDAVLSLHSNPH